MIVAATDAFLPARRLAMTDPDDPPRTMASNNWAVSPRRSATGHALLAGDPHLDLSLPSIWYEAHLVVPGKARRLRRDDSRRAEHRHRLQPRRRVDVHEHRRRRARLLRRARGRRRASQAVSGGWRVASGRAAHRAIPRHARRNDRDGHALLHASRPDAPRERPLAVDALDRARGGPRAERLLRRVARHERDGSRRCDGALVHGAGAEHARRRSRRDTSPFARRDGIHPARRRKGQRRARRQHERERLDRRPPRCAVPAGLRSRAGLSRVGQSAANRSARGDGLVGRQLRSVARGAHQHAAARRLGDDAVEDARVSDGSGQRARRSFRSGVSAGPPITCWRAADRV